MLTCSSYRTETAVNCCNNVLHYSPINCWIFVQYRPVQCPLASCRCTQWTVPRLEGVDARHDDLHLILTHNRRRRRLHLYNHRSLHQTQNWSTQQLAELWCKRRLPDKFRITASYLVPTDTIHHQMVRCSRVSRIRVSVKIKVRFSFTDWVRIFRRPDHISPSRLV